MVTIASDAFNGMVLLHQKKILHRDIKPENIASRDGRAWLIDFGGAMKIGEDVEMMSTLHFMSPNMHNSGKACVRDDLIMLVYTFIWMFYPRIFTSEGDDKIYDTKVRFENTDFDAAIKPMLEVIEKPPSDKCSPREKMEHNKNRVDTYIKFLKLDTLRHFQHCIKMSV